MIDNPVWGVQSERVCYVVERKKESCYGPPVPYEDVERACILRHNTNTV